MPGGPGRLALADIGSADRAAAPARWRAGDLREASARRTGLDMHPESRDAGACRLSNFDAGVAAAAKTAPLAGPQERSARERGHPQRPDPCAGPQADNARPTARSATRCSARSTTASSGAWTTGTFPAGAVGGCVHDGARIPVNFRHALTSVARRLEALVPGQVQAVGETVARLLQDLGECVGRARPGRSHERVSRRPDERFRNRKGKSAENTPATTTRVA